MKFAEGRSFPLGATVAEGGVNLCVYSGPGSHPHVRHELRYHARCGASHLRGAGSLPGHPDVKSIVAMVPATISLRLMFIPAMLSALSVVREKEMGSIVNFYVAPTTRLEFPLTTHFVMLARGILCRGAGLDVVWKPRVTLFAIGAVLFGWCVSVPRSA